MKACNFDVSWDTRTCFTFLKTSNQDLLPTHILPGPFELSFCALSHYLQTSDGPATIFDRHVTYVICKTWNLNLRSSLSQWSQIFQSLDGKTLQLYTAFIQLLSLGIFNICLAIIFCMFQVHFNHLWTEFTIFWDFLHNYLNLIFLFLKLFLIFKQFWI